MDEENKTKEWEFLVGLTSEEIGWKSKPALKAVKAAIRELKKVARQDKTLAAEGVVIMLERLPNALSIVDASAGGFLPALESALEGVLPLFIKASVNRDVRKSWTERIYTVYIADEMGCLESLGKHWGALCVDVEIASEWADKLLEESKLVWAPERGRGYIFKGMSNCLSALLAAGRGTDLLALLAMAPRKTWNPHSYGVKALFAMGQIPEAMEYAKAAGAHENPIIVAKLCEELFLGKGLIEQAYGEYAMLANETNTYQAWYRAVVKKYSEKSPEQILADLVAFTPGNEGKWFAAAKSAGLYDEAIALAKQSASSPETLIRASRDYTESRPEFAREAALVALEWLSKGHGYDKTEALVHDAYEHLMEASISLGTAVETKATLQRWMETDRLSDRFVNRILYYKLNPE